jgi:hypothetical protein
MMRSRTPIITAWVRVAALAMTEWGDRWLGDGNSPLMLRSKSSGERLRVALVDETGKVAKPSDIETVVTTRANGRKR